MEWDGEFFLLLFFVVCKLFSMIKNVLLVCYFYRRHHFRHSCEFKVPTWCLSMHNIAMQNTHNTLNLYTTLYYICGEKKKKKQHWTWYNLDLMLLKWLRSDFVRLVAVSQLLTHFTQLLQVSASKVVHSRCVSLGL